MQKPDQVEKPWALLMATCMPVVRKHFEVTVNTPRKRWATGAFAALIVTRNKLYAEIQNLRIRRWGTSS